MTHGGNRPPVDEVHPIVDEVCPGVDESANKHAGMDVVPAGPPADGEDKRNH